MQCKEQRRWQAMIIDRLVNQLSEEDTVLLEQHLSDCGGCMREAQSLAGMLHKAAGPEEWTADQAIEGRLLAALDHRYAGGHQHRRVTYTGARPDESPMSAGARWVEPVTCARMHWDGNLARSGRHAVMARLARLRTQLPLPAWSALALVLIAAAGLWTGRVKPGSSLPQAIVVAQDWVGAPADANRMPARETGHGRSAADLLVFSPSFARATPDVRGCDASADFVPAKSDAISPPGRMLADSL